MCGDTRQVALTNGGAAMGCAVEVLAVLALVMTGIAIMVGVSPGDALRRLGAVLLFLFIVPMLMAALFQGVIAPVLTRLRTVAQEIAVLLAVIAALALIGWLALHRIQRRSETNDTTIREE